MAVYQLGDDRPEIAATAWVAESAEVMGRIVLADRASVWYGAVLRGDNERITVGARSNVQDGSVLHTDRGFPLVIGEDVTVGHRCTLHGCTVGDGALIGIQAVVLNGARIGRECLVAAGAVVTEGQVFEDGQLIVGAPARALRALKPEQLARMRLGAAHYVAQAELHRTRRVKVAG